MGLMLAGVESDAANETAKEARGLPPRVPDRDWHYPIRYRMGAIRCDTPWALSGYDPPRPAPEGTVSESFIRHVQARNG
jgi:hypothetical protein